MSSFNDRLERVLSEMPVRHFKAAGNEPDPARNNTPGGYFAANFKGNSYGGYTSPKYMEIVSDKLSRLSGYNINIFIMDGDSNELYVQGESDIETLSRLTGLPLGELEDAINFVMTGNNGQREFSPWLYMHQLGEAINNSWSVDEQGDCAKKYFNEFYSRMNKLVPDWGYRLKMGSARTAKKNGVGIGDLHQELITEFLWHGGRIRFDYPDDVSRSEVDEVFDIFKTVLRRILDESVGTTMWNDVGR